MRKTITVFMVVFVWMAANAGRAQEIPFSAERSWFLEETQNLKKIMPRSRDAILINDLWYSCLMTITQIDAYYMMMAIYDTIPKDKVTEDAAGFIISWLTSIRNINDLNIKTLNAMDDPVDLKTTKHVDQMKVGYEKLNGLIEVEIDKLTVVKYTQ